MKKSACEFYPSPSLQSQFLVQFLMFATGLQKFKAEIEEGVLTICVCGGRFYCGIRQRFTSILGPSVQHKNVCVCVLATRKGKMPPTRRVSCPGVYVYGVATISRLLKIIGPFCRISSFL